METKTHLRWTPLLSFLHSCKRQLGKRRAPVLKMPNSCVSGCCSVIRFATQENHSSQKKCRGAWKQSWAMETKTHLRWTPLLSFLHSCKRQLGKRRAPVLKMPNSCVSHYWEVFTDIHTHTSFFDAFFLRKESPPEMPWHGGTPSHHPFLGGIFPKTIQRPWGTTWLWTPLGSAPERNLSHGTLRRDLPRRPARRDRYTLDAGHSGFSHVWCGRSHTMKSAVTNTGVWGPHDHTQKKTKKNQRLLVQLFNRTIMTFIKMTFYQPQKNIN